MKLDHSEVVLSFEGDPLRETGSDGVLREMTFRSLVVMALNGTEEGERMGAEEKARAYQLSTKFFRGKKVDLTLDERAFIKDRAGRLLTAPAYGRLSDWLEGNPQLVESDDGEGAAT